MYKKPQRPTVFSSAGARSRARARAWLSTWTRHAIDGRGTGWGGVGGEADEGTIDNAVGKQTKTTRRTGTRAGQTNGSRGAAQHTRFCLEVKWCINGRRSRSSDPADPMLPTSTRISDYRRCGRATVCVFVCIINQLERRDRDGGGRVLLGRCVNVAFCIWTRHAHHTLTPIV